MTGFIEVIIVFISSTLAYFFGRKKQIAEINKLRAEAEHIGIQDEAANIKNVRELIAIYKQISEDMKFQLTEVHHECTLLRQEVQLLRKENKSLKEQLAQFTRTMNAKS